MYVCVQPGRIMVTDSATIAELSGKIPLTRRLHLPAAVRNSPRSDVNMGFFSV